MDYRKQILPALVPYFEKDDRLFLLYGDSGFGGIEALTEKFPKRVCNFGIAEQAMIGVAAGMAMSGMIPVVYAISNFIVYRALEQVRNDIVLQGQNVKLIGAGANDYFSFLGKSHTCGDQDITIMETIGIDVYDPYNVKYLSTLSGRSCNKFDEFLESFMLSPKAGYIRV